MADGPDEIELMGRFIATRDASLREKLILRYVPIVHYVLGRLGITSASLPNYDDAVSQGLIGLIEAVDRFDPKYGTQFSTYATLLVRGRVLDFLRSLDWLTRSARRRARAIQDATDALWNRLGRAPSEEELASFLDMDLPTLQQSLVDASLLIVSLDSVTDLDEDGESSLHELLRDDKHPDPGENIDRLELRQALIQAIKSLPEREQQLLSLYYYNELTLKEIGEVLQVSEARVCQLHSRAVINLRATINEMVNGVIGNKTKVRCT
jgi:RNA polymerase sigma factor for flagellar operon FliA